MTKLRVEIQRGEGGVRVALAGVIDADLDAALDPGALEGAVVLDLGGVSRITSFGVREWMSLLRRARASYLCFVNVRPTLVSQFNMVSGFDGGGQLVSFYLPYLCEGCEHEEQRLLDLRRDYGVVSADAPPAVRCPMCEQTLVLDETPATFFHFASARPRPRPPPEAAALIDGARDDDAAGQGARPLSIRKEVAGEVTAIWLGGELSRRARLRRVVDGVEGRVVVICASLTGFSREQTSALAPLSRREPGFDLVLARAPVGLLEGMDPGLRARFEGRVLSVTATLTCADCAAAQVVELDRDGLTGALVSGTVACASCSGAAWLGAQGNALAACFPLLASEVDPAVRAYLEARPGGELELAEDDERGPAERSYRILEEIGRGGMAEVFLAERTGPAGFAKRVALKRILPEHCQQPGFVKLFLDEARTAARIDHPNVARIFDLGKEGDRFYIVMELVRGWDLSSILSTCRRLKAQMPVEVACRIAADVCAGLHAAHTLPRGGIVHRDVSPHNVLVSDEGAVKVTDFGIAQAIGAEHDGELRGKVVYMAPEQVDPDVGAIDARTDVYAAGLLLFECLTNFAPLYRLTRVEVLQAAVVAQIPDVRDERPEVPAEIAAVLKKALQRDPGARYASALQMQLALDTALSHLGTPSTSAHLSQWLDALRAQAAAEEAEPSKPMRLPQRSELTDTFVEDEVDLSKTAPVSFEVSLIED